jgi:hypothetical protein
LRARPPLGNATSMNFFARVYRDNHLLSLSDLMPYTRKDQGKSKKNTGAVAPAYFSDVPLRLFHFSAVKTRVDEQFAFNTLWQQ